MSDGPRVVRTVYKGLDSWADALKEATEPCVSLRLYAHGSHVRVAESAGSVCDELDEAILIPMSWFERLEKRIEELEARAHRHSPWGQQSARGRPKDGMRVEDLPCHYCGAKNVLLGVTKGWRFCCAQCSEGREVQFSGEVMIGGDAFKVVKAMEASLVKETPQALALSGVVIFSPEELGGLDLHGFKSLLRIKIDDMADRLVLLFKERESG